MNKRQFAKMALLGALVAPTALMAQAQPYPNKPITMIVGFAAGGATDAVARLYAQKLSQRLQIPVLIDNKPGAAQLVAVNAVKTAPPDGYRLYMGTGSSLAQGPGMRRDLPYDPLKDFTPIALVGVTPGVAIINPSVPANNMKEFVEYVLKNPGKVNYGSAGAGTANHLQTEYFMSVTGTQMVHIPYKSDAEVVREVLGGSLQFSISTAQLTTPLIRTGKVRALAVTSSKPLPFVAGLPTLTEAGVKGLEGMEPYTFYGVVGPVGMPANVVNTLNAALNEISKMPDVIERMNGTLFTEPAIDSASGFRGFLEREVAKWRELGKKVKIE
ncbi:MAG: tripartite tricarboxylate transporter substrate-binding protein [Burkholderiaceae bacterium]|nr:tripartite tricarboxylate transporter substrate-binding protein [Burkholderiaceae bacterium]